MLSFLIIILCINIDAFSYGVAYGFQKIKFTKHYIFLVAIFSTIIFAIPLIVSKYVFQLFNPLICHIINALVLISLGIYYFLQKSPEYSEKLSQNEHFSKNNVNSYNLNNNSVVTTTKGNRKKPNKNSEIIYYKFKFKKFLLETLAISVDAFFTALLSGFNSNYYIFYIIFYAFTNFFAIFLGNVIFYHTNKKIKIKLSYFSGIIFIILGILKFFGI